jgi:gliding motility-associated-like protein
MKKSVFLSLLFVAFAALNMQAQQKTFALEQTDCKLIAPNAFTPNNDGVNDFFYLSVTGTCRILAFEIKIFDRWGRLVFQGDETTDQWDGTYDGRQLKEGVYLWQSSITWEPDDSGQNRGESKKGSLVLIR